MALVDSSRCGDWFSILVSLSCEHLPQALWYGFLGGYVVPVVFAALVVAGEIGVCSCSVETQVYVYWAAVPCEVEFPSWASEMVWHSPEGFGQLFGERFGVGEGGGSGALAPGWGSRCLSSFNLLLIDCFC